ncbi:CRISPR system precrRNA processing endoribonuclease RAMP protein Cas6 [Desulfohalobiaceae bacterium Ax17]|uniref:CRISPR system precrRNA processing endoribonuclease RAMP protein Cas6 n=1 Tax=Desulfovulcanus ferrireducens TaxID=2831190 RepID=UPI00207BB0B6|nr:CRISPR system precrRNA processing endoribonuclease RAMP protein Cas6 [Desulfovulcanus ferrireducens]MBT8763265.1 CRISPR system precrRNA processing endoribonuclease RAMP protein Cas6 [Desulfovulcanus ferrireducens]
MSWMEEMKLLPLEFEFSAKEEFVLPAYKGATFRGGFGHIFKKSVCVARSTSECKDCILATSCIYAYVFETPRPQKAEIMRKYEHIPHPFVLCPPLGKERLVKRNARLVVGLTLIGKAIDYLPYFVLVMEALGNQGIGADKGKCILECVRCKDKTVFSQGSSEIKPVTPFEWSELLASAPPRERISLEFLTPLKLVRKGQVIKKGLSFQDLFRSLLRRIALLSTFHCAAQPDVDFKGLIDLAANIQTLEDNTKWFHWSRYSTRQKSIMPSGGLVGSITFKGDFEPFWPFLLLGQYFHVGKNTSFGLGKYKCVEA